MNNANISWTLFCISLIVYGFLKDFKPGGPFLFKYQTNFLNLTEKQLNGEIYPYWTYSYLATLIPIFLSTDLLLYKPILILESVGCMIFRILLVFGSGVLSQQIGMAAYGIASATEIAFYSYIYAKVTKDDYKRLTSWTRASSMAGRTFSYLFSQAIISINIGTYLTINQVALISPIIVFIIGIYLPQISAYSQTLWGEVQKKKRHLMASQKRLIPQLASVLTAIAIMLMNMISIDWDKWGETALVLISSIDCALLLLFSQAQTIYVMYICYICYRTLYQLNIECNNNYLPWFNYSDGIWLKMIGESYGLIFGLNSFVALILQALLTMIVVDKRVYGMTVRPQFFVYGTCHAIIALIFLCSIVYNLTIRLRHRFNLTHPADLTIDTMKQNVVAKNNKIGNNNNRNNNNSNNNNSNNNSSNNNNSNNNNSNNNNNNSNNNNINNNNNNNNDNEYMHI
ncbi:Reduced folate carrier [Dirofilaria immitis]|nr:Reduced folate carrier [Dirofilaria immitis]